MECLLNQLTKLYLLEHGYQLKQIKNIIPDKDTRSNRIINAIETIKRNIINNQEEMKQKDYWISDLLK